MTAKQVSILGLGGGGSRITAGLLSFREALNLRLCAADTDAAALKPVTGDISRLQLGVEWANSEGCGGDASLGERAAGSSAESLKEFISGASFLMVVTALGGGAGAGAARIVARLVRQMKIPALFVGTLPFAFEGSWRRRQADAAMKELRELTNGIIVIPNDLLFTSFPADTPATQAFCMADTMLADGLSSLVRIVSAQGLIPADFAGFKSILKKRSGSCSLAVGRGDGENRLEKAMDSLIECPLLGGSQVLNQADAAVVSILGGADLSMGEIQTCMNALLKYFPEHAQVVTGAYSSETQNEFQITALVCRYENSGTRRISTAVNQVAAHQPKSGKNSRKTQKDTPKGPIQGELPLMEQTAGIFSQSTPTMWRGENLDIPTFQRRTVAIDLGD